MYTAGANYESNEGVFLPAPDIKIRKAASVGLAVDGGTIDLNFEVFVNMIDVPQEYIDDPANLFRLEIGHYARSRRTNVRGARSNTRRGIKWSPSWDGAAVLSPISRQSRNGNHTSVSVPRISHFDLTGLIKHQSYSLGANRIFPGWFRVTNVTDSFGQSTSSLVYQGAKGGYGNARFGYAHAFAPRGAFYFRYALLKDGETISGPMTGPLQVGPLVWPFRPTGVGFPINEVNPLSLGGGSSILTASWGNGAVRV